VNWEPNEHVSKSKKNLFKVINWTGRERKES
jgi:hypothetical protein